MGKQYKNLKVSYCPMTDGLFGHLHIPMPIQLDVEGKVVERRESDARDCGKGWVLTINGGYQAHDELGRELELRVNTHDELVRSVEAAKKLIDHIMDAKAKRVNWGASFVDWGLMNESLMQIEKGALEVKNAKKKGGANG